MDFKQYTDVIYKIVGAAMQVHSELRCGLLESIYQEALSLELSDMGIKNEIESVVHIHYHGHVLDKTYRIDMMVGDIILELKSVQGINSDHRAQLCNYLRLTKKPVGLLINFGEKHLYGERWGYDEISNECFRLDVNMERFL